MISYTKISLVIGILGIALTVFLSTSFTEKVDSILESEVVVVSNLEDELNKLKEKQSQVIRFEPMNNLSEKISVLQTIIDALKTPNPDSLQYALEIVNNQLNADSSDGIFLKSKAEILLKMERYGDAIILYGLILTNTEEDDFYLWNNIGVSHILNNEPEKAEIVLEDLRKKLSEQGKRTHKLKMPDQSENFVFTIVSNNLSIAKGELGKYQESIDILKKLVLDKMENYMTYNTLAVLYSMSEDFDEAFSSIEKALGLEPYNVKLKHNRDIISSQKQNVLSRTLFSNSISTNMQVNAIETSEVKEPECFDEQTSEFMLEADMFAQQRQYAMAEKHYAAILKCAPNDVPTRIKSAYTLTELGFFEEAEKQYREALLTEPENPFAKTGLGYLYAKWDNYDEAQRLCNDVIQSKPTFYRAFNCMGELEKNKGNLDKSIDYFINSISIIPENNVAYNGLGFSNLLNGKYDNSIGNYTKMLEYDPKNEDSLFGLGVSYDLIDNKKMANFYFDQMISDANDEYLKLIDRADKYNQNNNWESGLSLYFAIQGHSDDIDVINRISTGIANSYKGLRDYEEAEFFYLEVLKRSPEYFNALKGMCVIQKLRGLDESAQTYFDDALASPQYNASLELECKL